MLIAVDVDGTLDAFPQEFGVMLNALRAAGHTIAVLTGGDTDPVNPDVATARAQALAALGLAGCYDEMHVFPHPHDVNKAAWADARDVDVLFDNSKANAKAWAKLRSGPVFVPWQTRK